MVQDLRASLKGVGDKFIDSVCCHLQSVKKCFSKKTDYELPH